MKIISLIFKRLTPSDINGIYKKYANTKGGGQTYIDFSKKAINKEKLNNFFSDSGSESWKFKVKNLSKEFEQEAEISTRNNTSNCLRNQSKEECRLSIFNVKEFPQADSYQDTNPITLFIIKVVNENIIEHWAGWFYNRSINSNLLYCIPELGKLKTEVCGYIDLENSNLYLDKRKLHWPFILGNYITDKNQEEMENTDKTFYLEAIKTKPFLLLAGISGTGKSRIVREFAFKSCPEYLQDENGIIPGNYCMIEVKPNWHDSTELLGYYSNIHKQYQFTKFVKFLVKAMMFPNVPFFVCLDEMNLAPVEQYFAEILSIIETRKHPKGSQDIETDVIIDPRFFIEFSQISGTKNTETGDVFKQNLNDRDIYMKLFNIKEENNIDNNIGGKYNLTKKGLTIPHNIIIIGTVNMDDTTHQFSRKVIDRAMTIEMNGGVLKKMFGGNKDLEYLTKEEQKKWQNAFECKYVSADEVLDKNPDMKDYLIDNLSDKLENINKALKGTPFEVSYRVLNELTIMTGVMLDTLSDKKTESINKLIDKAINNILLMKILPRIEGDVDMFNLSSNYKPYGNRLEWLKELAPNIENSEHQTAKEKIQEMIDRLRNQEFTRFWP